MKEWSLTAQQDFDQVWIISIIPKCHDNYRIISNAVENAKVSNCGNPGVGEICLFTSLLKIGYLLKPKGSVLSDFSGVFGVACPLIPVLENL